MINRRQLPIASPCQQFVGQPATDQSPAYCTRCEKSVHDLSRMNEREVVTLLARHLGERMCVSYRVREDGAIALRPTPSRLAPAALALSLAGCAGHLSEIDATNDDCVDAAGYHMPCPSTRNQSEPVIPDAIETTPTAEVTTGPVVPVDEPHPVAGGIFMPDPNAVDGEIDVSVLEGDIDISQVRGDVAPDSRLDPGLMRKVQRERARLDREERRRKRTAQR